jgi:predicted CXXCH cytochrome family protein
MLDVEMSATPILYRELLFLLAVATATAILTVRHCPPAWRRAGLLTIPLLSLGLAVLYWWSAAPPPDVMAEVYLPKQSTDRGFVTSQTCRSCHPGAFASWHKTYHRTMTQVAGPGTIVEGARRGFQKKKSLSTHGQTATLERRDDEFWVNMVHPEWDKAKAAGIPEAVEVTTEIRADRRVILTTGSHHFQVFWIASERTGELWQFPWRYHIGEDRWVHRNDVFLQPPDKPAVSHFRTWNYACIHCHSAGGEPGMGSPPAMIFSQTRVGELGIACESCHGPSEEHVRKYRSPGKRLLRRILSGDDVVAENSSHEAAETTTPQSVVNPARLSPRAASQVCGQCHSHMVNHAGNAEGSIEFLKTGLAYRPGEDLDRFVRFLKLEDGYPGNEHRFWSDGTCRSGGREYLGLIASPCYQPAESAPAGKRQITCLSCHSMHNAPANDQLKPLATTNTACNQCHPRFQDPAELTAHTHHPANNPGSQCYNCHMPHVSYALFTAIRTHQVINPQVKPTGPDSRPNACNLCHLDRTLAWTAKHLTRWYDQPEVKLPEADRGVSAALRWLLAGDAAQRVITAWHFGWQPAREASGTDWILPRLAHVLDDPYPAVRFVGWQSLKSLPGLAAFSYDFDGTGAHRRKVIGQLLNAWSGSVAGGKHRPDAALLSRPDGGVDSRRLQQLRKTRDDRPIEIYE